MSDHPDLQALVYGDEDSDAEDSAVLDRRNWFKNAWGNVKKVVDTLKKLWNKWMKKVTGWLIKAGKAQACAVCYNPIPAPGMSWSDFRTVKSKIESIACDICY